MQFDADSSTAPLIVYPDAVSELHEVTQVTTLTATVATGTGYTPGSPASASPRILVIDPAVTVRIEEATYRFDEHATGAATAVHVVARTASGVPSPNTAVSASLSWNDGTALGRGVDYQSLSVVVSFEPSDFTADGPVFTARKAVQLALVDDTIAEMDETIEVSLEYAPVTAGVVALRLSDGATCPRNRCTSTVTIADNDTPRVTTPQVTIVADQDVFTARLDNVSFTLTRTGNTDAALTVSVTLMQDLELFTPEYLPPSVQFDADSSTAPLIVYPDAVSELHEVTQVTTLTATVATGTGYTPGSPASASPRILVIDPAVTVRIEEATYRFDEHATGAATAVHVVARTASGVPSPNTAVSASLSWNDGTALGRGVDYQSLSVVVSFEPSDFTADGPVFTARKAVQLALVDDTIAEMDETIEVSLEYAPVTAGVVALRLSDGATCPRNRCTSTVTIADNDTPRVTTPTVTSVVVASAPQSGNTYRWGETILFTVTFSEPVRVTGRPALEVGLDSAAGGAVQARFAGLTATQRPTVGTGPVPVSQHVHFAYTVQPSDRDADGIRIGVNPLRLASADRIRSGETGAAAELAHAALGPRTGHRVDGQPAAPVASAGIEIVDTNGLLLETLADGSRRLWVPEGGSARYGLKLKSRPTHRVVVSHRYMYQGDPDLAVPRNFTVDRSIAPDEWRTKTVWISVRAAQDADAENGQRVFANNSISRDPNYHHLVLPDVIAVEADDEPACTLNLGDLWCGVVTLGKVAPHGVGLVVGFSANLGGLSDDTVDQSFTYGMNTYTVTSVTNERGFGGTVLQFGLSSLLTEAERENLVLHVGNDSFAFSDADIPGLVYLWDSTMDWSSLDYVVVRLRFPPVPQG